MQRNNVIPSGWLDKDSWRERIFARLQQAEPEDINDTYINDLIAIAICLNNLDVVTFHLQTLSLKLEKKLEEKDLIEINSDNVRAIKKKNGREYISHYKVITDFFNQWAIDNQFNPGTVIPYNQGMLTAIGENEEIKLPTIMPTITAMLRPNLFHYLLFLGYISKDIGAGYLHGEFTHCLATYIWVEENKIRPFLKINPFDIYRLLGYPPYYIYKNKDHGITLWALIFDQANVLNFNCPETLNQALTFDTIKCLVNKKEIDEVNAKLLKKPLLSIFSNNPKLWALSALLSGRLEKRHLQYKGKIQEKKNKPVRLYLQDHVFFKYNHSESQTTKHLNLLAYELNLSSSAKKAEEESSLKPEMTQESQIFSYLKKI